jgi:hypothetical protein
MLAVSRPPSWYWLLAWFFRRHWRWFSTDIFEYETPLFQKFKAVNVYTIFSCVMALFCRRFWGICRLNFQPIFRKRMAARSSETLVITTSFTVSSPWKPQYSRICYSSTSTLQPDNCAFHTSLVWLCLFCNSHCLTLSGIIIKCRALPSFKVWSIIN